MKQNPFRQFNKNMLPDLNLMWNKLASLDNMRGDGFITTKRSGMGTVIGVRLNALREKLSRKGGGDATSVRIARCSEDAPSGDEITATLNSSQSPIGESITVTCNISNGSDLNEATPRLEIGDDILVARVAYWDWVGVAQGEPTPARRERWYCLTNFQTTEDCTCGA